MCFRRQVKERLMAYNGKLITVKEQIGDTSNGTGFNITTQAAPELDSTSLAIGEVVEGMPIVQDIARLPAVRSQSNSAFFKCAPVHHNIKQDVIGCRIASRQLICHDLGFSSHAACYQARIFFQECTSLISHKLGECGCCSICSTFQCSLSMHIA